MARPENLTRRCGAAENVREVLKISLRSLRLKNSSADFIRDPEEFSTANLLISTTSKAPRDGRHPGDVFG